MQSDRRQLFRTGQKITELIRDVPPLKVSLLANSEL